MLILIMTLLFPGWSHDAVWSDVGPGDVDRDKAVLRPVQLPNSGLDTKSINRFIKEMIRFNLITQDVDRLRIWAYGSGDEQIVADYESAVMALESVQQELQAIAYQKGRLLAGREYEVRIEAARTGLNDAELTVMLLTELALMEFQ